MAGLEVGRDSPQPRRSLDRAAACHPGGPGPPRKSLCRKGPGCAEWRRWDPRDALCEAQGRGAGLQPLRRGRPPGPRRRGPGRTWSIRRDEPRAPRHLAAVPPRRPRRLKPPPGAPMTPLPALHTLTRCAAVHSLAMSCRRALFGRRSRAPLPTPGVAGLSEDPRHPDPDPPGGAQTPKRTRPREDPASARARGRPPPPSPFPGRGPRVRTHGHSAARTPSARRAEDTTPPEGEHDDRDHHPQDVQTPAEGAPEAGPPTPMMETEQLKGMTMSEPCCRLSARSSGCRGRAGLRKQDSSSRSSRRRPRRTA